MAPDRSPEFKGVIVQILCIVEIQFESAWALNNQYKIGHHLPCLMGPNFHAISMIQTQDMLGRIHIGPLFDQTRTRTTRQGVTPILSSSA